MGGWVCQVKCVNYFIFLSVVVIATVFHTVNRSYAEPPKQVFHLFTVGASMLGWRTAPTGFVSCPASNGQDAEPVPKPVAAYNAGSCCQYFNYHCCWAVKNFRISVSLPASCRPSIAGFGQVPSLQRDGCSTFCKVP